MGGISDSIEIKRPKIEIVEVDESHTVETWH